MSTNDKATLLNDNKRHSKIALLLLGGLLFLRFPFLIGAVTLLPRETVFRSALTTVDSGGTYLLTALLIWWEREHLRDFWIDLASAITFLCQMFYFPIGIGLFWAMRRDRVKFPAPPTRVWRWLCCGAILALVCNILIAILGLFPSQPRSVDPATLSFLIPAMLVQMTNAAVFEEPLFRGFLWGYLRRWSWPNGWIWLLQAALFTLGHVYYLKNEAFVPWLIRMTLPALLFGFIAWRSRSIFASMVTHGMCNASGDMILHARSISEAISLSWKAVLILVGILVGICVAEWLRRNRASNTMDSKG